MSIGIIQAQSTTLSWFVLSAADNQPMPGVTVIVDGTTIGTVTSFEGVFTLEVPQDETTLIFSFVGYSTQNYEIDFANPTSIQIVLEEDYLQLDEIIVTGYSTRVKNSITGSTVKVKSDEFKDIPVTSVDQTMQGRVAGLTV